MKSGRAFGRFTEDSDRFRATEVGRAEVVRRLDLEDETDPLGFNSRLVKHEFRFRSIRLGFGFGGINLLANEICNMQ